MVFLGDEPANVLTLIGACELLTGSIRVMGATAQIEMRRAQNDREPSP